MMRELSNHIPLRDSVFEDLHIGMWAAGHACMQDDAEEVPTAILVPSGDTALVAEGVVVAQVWSLGWPVAYLERVQAWSDQGLVLLPL